MSTKKEKRKCPARSAVTKYTDHKYFDEIMTVKEAGDFQQFEGLLKEAFTSTDKDIRAQACYELALLNCQQNNHEEADSYLRRLGYRYKLSRNIWLYDDEDMSAPASTPDVLKASTGIPGVVHCFDEVIPQELLSKLQDVFAPASPFWAEHGYPADSFFSYNVPISTSEASSKNKKKSCANLMEQLALFLKPIVATSFPEMAIGETASIEWWAHTRSNGASAGHRLHYDLDEMSLQEHGELSAQSHPFVSSVLYLDDGGASGAPTLVTNQSVLQNMYDNGSDDDSEESNAHSDTGEGSEEGSEGIIDTEEMAWLCPPKTNRLLLFDGSLLHGVVPHIRNKQQAASSVNTSADSPRVTLMIGWWGSHVAISDTPTMCCQDSQRMQHALTNLKPNMCMPKCDSDDYTVVVTSNKKNKQKKRSVNLSWPTLFENNVSVDKLLLGKVVVAQPSAGLIRVEGDIWEEVSERKDKGTEKGDSEEVLESDIQFLGNWFLSSRTEILDQIEYNSEMCREKAIGATSGCVMGSEGTTVQGHHSQAGDTAGAVGWMSAEDLKRLRGE